MRLEARHDAVVSGLRLVLLVVEERFRFALLLVEPAVRIGQSPDDEFTHVRFFEEHVHELAVQMPLLCIVCGGELARFSLRETDVEFRDVECHVEFRERLGERAYVLRGRLVRDFDMRLRAHAGDGNSVLFPALHLLHDEARLGTFAQAPFEGVVVVAEFCIRVGLVRPDECGIQEFGADAFVPHGTVGAPAGIVVIVHGLVHHVPFGNLALVMPDNLLDVVLEYREQFFLLPAVIAADPCGNLAVPGEGVAAHAHLVRLRVFDHLVAFCEIEFVLGRFGCVELHLVFGDNHVELRLVDFFEFRLDGVVEPFAVQDGPDEAPAFLGELPDGRFCGKGACESRADEGCPECDTCKVMAVLHLLLLFGPILLESNIYNKHGKRVRV